MYISSTGPLKGCTIAFVGESVTDSDIRENAPFSGTIGNLFNFMLMNAGINRSDCYLTYVVKQRIKPDISKIIQFPVNSRSKVKITEDYIEHEKLLLEELSKCSANIIVALGKTALYALTRQTKISSWRGSILESTTLPGRKVIATADLDTANKQYLLRHHVLFDLRRAKIESSSPTIDLPTPHLITNPSFQEALDFIESAHNYTHVGFDIETPRNQVDCFAIAVPDGPSMCIPLVSSGVYAGGSPHWPIDQEEKLLTALAKLLADKGVTKVLQNAIFDCTFLYKRYGMITNTIADTMIAMGVLYPDFPKSLAFITSVFTRHPYYKDDGKDVFKGFSESNDNKFWLYNARDSYVTLEAYFKLLPELTKLGNLDTYRSHVELIHPLMFMQERGVPMDKEGMEREKTLSAHHIESVLLPELRKLTGQELNPLSSQQLQKYFYTDKKLTPYVKDKRPTVDHDALVKIARKGYREADVILEIRKFKKLISTYLNVSLDSDNVMRCAYNPAGTTTGRLSSRETIWGTGGNRQNQPHSMKKFMKVRDGMVPYYKDLKGAENRIVAYVGNVPAMIKAFESGMDVHSLTASLLYNIPYEDVSKIKGSAGIQGSDKSQRDMGKMTNHSGNYGVSYRTLATRTDTPESVTKILLDRYFSIYPEIKLVFQAHVIERLNADRTLTNCFGRKRLFLDRLESCFEPAYAFIPQSTVADIINRWGLSYIYNTPELEHVYIFDQVHDSIGFEIPLDLGWEYHARANQLIDASLSQTLQWKTREFYIPAETKMFRGTLANDKELIYDYKSDVSVIANYLEECYDSLQDSLAILDQKG
jgi:uracil-DNA glycosylase family 4